MKTKTLLMGLIACLCLTCLIPVSANATDCYCANGQACICTPDGCYCADGSQPVYVSHPRGDLHLFLLTSTARPRVVNPQVQRMPDGLLAMPSTMQYTQPMYQQYPQSTCRVNKATGQMECTPTYMGSAGYMSSLTVESRVPHWQRKTVNRAAKHGMQVTFQ